MWYSQFFIDYPNGDGTCFAMHPEQDSVRALIIGRNGNETWVSLTPAQAVKLIAVSVAGGAVVRVFKSIVEDENG